MNRLLAFLAFLPLTVLAQDFKCTTPVNPKKAVVFINLNASFLEAAAAEKGACARGEIFVHIPELTSGVKNFSEAYIKKELLIVQLKHDCWGTRQLSPDEIKACDIQDQELSNLQIKVDAARDSVPEVDKSSVQKILKGLADKDISTTSVILSGHDGGGTISGEFGMIDKHEFIDAFDEAYEKKPKLKDDLQSSLLWGCYTSTPIEVLDWKKRIPQLKIIAGFAGSGPSNLRQAGHDLMYDLLAKEKSIIQSESMEAAQIAIEGLRGAGETNIGLYAQCSEKKDEYYSLNEHLNQKFTRFNDAQDCLSKSVEVSNLQRSFDAYLDGSTPLPDVTSSGPLRDLYTRSRALAHCLEPDGLLNPDRVGLLLFSKGMQKNFAQTFSKEIKAYADECEKLDELVALSEFKESTLIDNKKNMSFACEKLKPFLTPDQLDPISRSDISAMANKLFGAGFMPAAWDSWNEYGKRREKMPAAYKMSQLIMNYLYGLNPNCMDFILWHEYRSGEVATPGCQL